MPSQPQQTRHVSIRVPDALFAELETEATLHDETVSQCARRLLGEGLVPRPGSAATLDDVISVLQRIRRELTLDGRPASPPPSTAPSDPDAGPVEPAPARTVNVLNAKANLSRLLADVERGDEIVIAHAGAARARLVPVADRVATPAVPHAL